MVYDFEVTINNFIVLIVLFAVAVWFYKSMKDGKLKQLIKENLEKIKAGREEK